MKRCSLLALAGSLRLSSLLPVPAPAPARGRTVPGRAIPACRWMRSGMTGANLLEPEIVLASSDIVIANAHRNADLFWALSRAGPRARQGRLTRAGAVAEVYRLFRRVEPDTGSYSAEMGFHAADWQCSRLG